MSWHNDFRIVICESDCKTILALIKEGELYHEERMKRKQEEPLKQILEMQSSWKNDGGLIMSKKCAWTLTKNRKRTRS